MYQQKHHVSAIGQARYSKLGRTDHRTEGVTLSVVHARYCRHGWLSGGDDIGTETNGPQGVIATEVIYRS